MIRRYPITPVPKPRQTQRDKWRPSKATKRYRAFADEVRAHGVRIPESGAHVTFVMPMPVSWSKRARARMDGRPHQQKPDKDNLEKACLDALYGDDSGVWDLRVTKVWGAKGEIIVETGGDDG